MTSEASFFLLKKYMGYKCGEGGFVNQDGSQVAYRQGNPYMAYKAQEILSMSPEQLVLKLYDYVIAACKGRDSKKASSGLAVLIDSLDFEAGEMATGLFRLYRYAMEKVKTEHFDEALKVVGGLREAWTEAFKSSSAT